MGPLHDPTDTDAEATEAPVVALVMANCQGPADTASSDASLHTTRWLTGMLVKVVVAVPFAGMFTVAVRVATEPVPSWGGETEMALRTVAPVESTSSVTVLIPFSTVSGRQVPAVTETGVAPLILNRKAPVTLPFLQMSSVAAPSPGGVDPAASIPELIPRVMASVSTAMRTVPNETETHRLVPVTRDVRRGNIRWVSSLAGSPPH